MHLMFVHLCLICSQLNLRVILDKYSSGQYGTAHEMRKDITQVWRNCLLLSGPDAVLYKTAKTLACAFDDAYCQSVAAPAHQGEGWVVERGGRDLGVGDGGLVGRAVSVYWACDHEWYCGKVTEHKSTGGAGKEEKYLVVFDGDAPVDSNWFELPSVDVCLLEDEEEEGRNGRGKRTRKSVAHLEGKDDAKETGRADHPQWCDCSSRRDRDGRWNLKAGDKVVGRYKDGNWYHAIVGRKEGDSYVLIWDDGDKDDTLKGMDEVCAPPPSRRDGEYDEQEWETYRRKKRDGGMYACLHVQGASWLWARSAFMQLINTCLASFVCLSGGAALLAKGRRGRPCRLCGGYGHYAKTCSARGRPDLV